MALWPVSQLKHGAHPPAVTRPEAPTTPLPSPLALSARHSRRDSGVRSDSLRGARSQGASATLRVVGAWLADRLTPALLSKLQSSGLVRFDDVSSKPCLDEQALLELCDAARAGLLEGSMTEAVAEKVTRFLRAAVKDESLGIATIELSTITNTRLDKLVADLQSPENFIGTNLPHFWRDYAAAERLQRLWRARFRERYFDVDQTRYSNLPEQGLLRYVDFDDTKRGHGHLWQAVACELLSGGQGNMQFEAGQDGIVNSAVEKLTKGPYHVTALPLLSGWEDVSSPAGTVKYVREGSLSNMHLSLLSQVGTQIRILRGYCLESPLAPSAGIRYDGLYAIRRYSLKLSNKTGLHRLVLTIERVAGQRPLHEVTAIPRPSQLDDWQLFEKYEGDMIRQRRGDQEFLEWKRAKAEERITIGQWRRTLELRAELKCGTHPRPSKGSLLSQAEVKDGILEAGK